MVWDFFRKKTKKARLREQLERNKANGAAGQDRYELEEMIVGNEIERTGIGSDYRRRTRGLNGKVKRSRLNEIKASKTASVTPLQRKGIKKGNVDLVRYDMDAGFGFGPNGYSIYDDILGHSKGRSRRNRLSDDPLGLIENKSSDPFGLMPRSRRKKSDPFSFW